jgi:hypothetical protein
MRRLSPLALLVSSLCAACSAHPEGTNAAAQKIIPSGGGFDTMYGIDANATDPGSARATMPAVLATGAHTVRWEYLAGSGYDANPVALAGDIQALAAAGVGVNVEIDYQSVMSSDGSGPSHQWRDCPQMSKDDAANCWSDYVSQFTAAANGIASNLQTAPNEYVLWNEPDMLAPIPPDVLADLVASACPAIKNAAPGARVALGGLALPDNTPFTSGRWSYMQIFYQTLVGAGQQGCLDVVNFHAYANLGSDGPGTKVYAFSCTDTLTSRYDSCHTIDLAHTVNVIENTMPGYVIGMDEWGVGDVGIGQDASVDLQQVLSEQIDGYFQAVSSLGISEASFYSWGDPHTLRLSIYSGAQQHFASDAGWISSSPF